MIFIYAVGLLTLCYESGRDRETGCGAVDAAAYFSYTVCYRERQVMFI